MPWTYSVRDGAVLTPAGLVAGFGYSGYGEYKNRPECSNEVDLGPVCCGWYDLLPPHDLNGGPHGPYVIGLLPDAGNEMHGRGDFALHGDSLSRPGTASKGCVILARLLRERMWVSGDHRLQVVADRNRTPRPAGAVVVGT